MPFLENAIIQAALAQSLPHDFERREGAEHADEQIGDSGDEGADHMKALE